MRRYIFFIVGFFSVIAIAADIFFLSQVPQSSQAVTPPPTIIVKIAREFYATCDQDENKTTCYKNLLSSYAGQHSVREAAAVLEALKGYEPTLVYCHAYAHEIAQAAVTKDSDKWLDVIREIDIVACSRGYFHGVLEAVANTHPEFVLSQSTISSICNKINSEFDYRLHRESNSLCHHAIGHMLLVQEKGVIEPAIAICQKLDTNSIYSCVEGVFMENTNRDNLQDHAILSRIKWDEELIAQLDEECIKHKAKIADACWNTNASVYGMFFHGDPETIMKKCSLAEDQAMKDGCFLHAVGFSAFQQIEKQELEKNIFNACNYFSESGRNSYSCIGFIVHYLIFTDPAYVSVVKKNCEKLRSDIKKECVAKTNEYVSEYKNQKKIASLASRDK